MPKMHETARRLYQAASQIKGAEGPSAVGALLGEKPQTVKNWESRGVSESGKVKARERIGCDTYWLSTGEGTMEVQGSLARVADGPQTAAMVAAAPTLTQALEVLAAHMDNLSEADREAAAQSLQTLARAPDSAKAKAGALASLGAQHNTAIGAGETPHFLKK